MKIFLVVIVFIVIVGIPTAILSYCIGKPIGLIPVKPFAVKGKLRLFEVEIPEGVQG